VTQPQQQPTPQAILVKATIEGTERVLICMKMEKDPFIPDRIVLHGVNDLRIEGRLKVNSMSLKAQDIQYYALVEQTGPLPPGMTERTQPTEAAPSESSAPTTPDNGGGGAPVIPIAEGKKRVGRPRKPAAT